MSPLGGPWDTGQPYGLAKFTTDDPSDRGILSGRGHPISNGEGRPLAAPPAQNLANLARASSVELREGIATVWRNDGHYLGCIGVEAWRQLVREVETLRAGEALPQPEPQS